MQKFIMLLYGMCMLYTLSLGQGSYSLKGVAIDDENHPLIGASVFLYPIEKGTIADDKGEYIFQGLKAGSYIIEISFIGYRTLVDTLNVFEDITFNVQLKPVTLNLQEVVITDHHAETRRKEETLNMEIVNDKYLKKNLGGSLMSSLERLPGVTTIDIGSGQSKPVIRGLGFNRVVVVENNIKHEAQQWGVDHGLEIDQYAIDNIEVIKGPASLMYGSDAIGGVIDMKNRHVPAENSFGGAVDLTGKTNNDLLGTSISLFGRKKWFFIEARATLIDYGDYKVPTDSVDIYSYKAALHDNFLRNTAGREENYHLTMGLIQNGWQNKLTMSNVNGKNGFFANAHGIEPLDVDTLVHDKSSRDILFPYHEVKHIKVINNTRVQWEKTILESSMGFQRNLREESSQYMDHGYMPAVFPDTLPFPSHLEREFSKQVYTGNIKLSCPAWRKTRFKVGLSSEFQDNQISGRGFIIPAYRQIMIGAFVLVKYALSNNSLIQLGIRHDNGHIATEGYHDWFPTPVVGNGDTIMKHLQRAENLKRDFSSFSWSIGYNLDVEKWSVKANAGKSFRMPIAKELAANGINYHRFSFEVGNPGLSPETSYQLDAGLEYSTRKFAVGTTPFLNYFSNYIYLNPTAEHDGLYGNGNQVFYYAQSKVIRFGGEIHAHYELVKAIQLGVIGEYVYAEQLSGDKKGYGLPFLPPPSAIFNVKYQNQEIGFIKNFYFSFDYRVTSPQYNIVPPEETTNGFQLVNIGVGGDIPVNNQKINLSFQVNNLLNTKYFNHTSYYRLINVPGSGRNFILNISIPFSSKINIVKH